MRLSHPIPSLPPSLPPFLSQSMFVEPDNAAVAIDHTVSFTHLLPLLLRSLHAACEGGLPDCACCV